MNKCIEFCATFEGQEVIFNFIDNDIEGKEHATVALFDGTDMTGSMMQINKLFETEFHIKYEKLFILVHGNSPMSRFYIFVEELDLEWIKVNNEKMYNALAALVLGADNK